MQVSPVAKGEKVSTPEIKVGVFAATTESFSQRNLNCDILNSFEWFRSAIQDSKIIGLRVRAYITVVPGCPSEVFDVNPNKVVESAADQLESGEDEISRGDTTGMVTAPLLLLACQILDGAGYVLNYS